MAISWIRALVIATLVGYFVPTATAQCVRPDGLDGGPCCTQANPRYPTPPSFTQDSLMICWRNCDVEAFSNCRAVWGASTFSTLASCKRIRQSLDLVDAAGVVKWRGRMTLQYSRTWLETDAAGNDMQVWRYLVNGDLRPTTAAGSTPCPVPPCAAANGNRVRFTGYRDYVRECGTNVVQNAWMLTHACDIVEHNPSFPRGGFFHPDRSYTLVGPSAGFVITPVSLVASGGGTTEGIRRVGSGGAISCEYKEQIDFGLDVQQELCVCGTPNGPFQWAISDLGLASSCGTSIFTPGGPYLPGYMSMSIGTWIDPSAYPGVEGLRYNTGGYDYFDPCAGVTREEVFYGVTTMGGYAATSIQSSGVGLPLPLTFIDQANSLSGPGASAATTMNVPFRSDHVLTLNL